MAAQMLSFEWRSFLVLFITMIFYHQGGSKFQGPWGQGTSSWQRCWWLTMVILMMIMMKMRMMLQRCWLWWWIWYTFTIQEAVESKGHKARVPAVSKSVKGQVHGARGCYRVEIFMILQKMEFLWKNFNIQQDLWSQCWHSCCCFLKKRAKWKEKVAKLIFGELAVR